MRIKYLFFSFFMLSVVLSANCQQKSLSPAQLKEDFEIFKGSIIEAHAGLYWYNDTSTIDNRLASISASIQQKKSQTEFHRLLQEFYAGINCGHSWMSRPYEFVNKRDSGNYYFPFQLFFDGTKATLFKDYSTDESLNIGDEVLKIDGMTIAEIFKILYRYIPSDGYNLTSKNRIIAGQFPLYYQQYIQLKDEVVLTVKGKDGISQEIRLNCIDKTTFEERSKSEFSTKPEDLLSFKIIDDQTALLRIKTFSKDWIKYQQKISFKKFLKESFTEIQEKQISKLILDLRSNGGGDDGLGALLNTYLIPEKFRYFDKMELSTKKFSYLQYSNTKGLKWASILIKKSKEKPNTYLWTHHQPLKEQKPNKLVYTGELVILTNGSTFSTAADVCAILHANKRGTFAGEEVGGGYYGNNSAISMDIQLPNSGIRYWIPLVRYTNYVDYPEFIGHGVIPKQVIPFTFNDLIDPEDLVLKKSMKLFKTE